MRAPAFGVRPCLVSQVWGPGLLCSGVLTKFPIGEIRDEFFSALESGPGALVVEAPTGRGKSTHLPLWMQASLGAAVLVVEPRRVVCRALARYLAGDDVIGRFIGYRVRLDQQAEPDCQIVFVTPGVAFNMLASGELKRFAGVMFDEFHERSWECDLLLAMLRAGAQARDSSLPSRWVLTSAALEAEALAQTLDARVLRCSGRAHPVSIEFAGEGGPSSEELEGRAASWGLALSDLRGLESDFPRQWVYQGYRYDCRIELRRRRVVLAASSTGQRRVKEPPPQQLGPHLPRFRGFKDFYQKASRQFELRR